MSRILVENDDSARSPTVGGCQPDFRSVQLRGFAFPILRFYGTSETNFPNHHFRWAAFWSKTTILRERQRWADSGPISAHYNYEAGCDCPILRLYGTFWKLIPRIITSDESHFGQKRRFCVSANGGRISVRFPHPLQLRGDPLFQFTGLQNFPETNSPNIHFR